MIENIILDRDGTLIEHIHYCGNHKSVRLNIDVYEFLQSFDKENVKFILLSNQSGIERGLYSFQELFQVHLKMMYKLNTVFLRSYYATSFKSKYRKPFDVGNLGLDFLTSGNTIIIGDSLTDYNTGKKSNIECFVLNTNLKAQRIPIKYESFNQILKVIEYEEKNLETAACSSARFNS